MAHNPVNHPAQPIYRAIGGLIGLYLVVFGVLGAIVGGGGEFLAQDDTSVLGQGTNLGFSVISTLLGAVILVATAFGRNIDASVNTWLGYALMALGLIALAFSRTDANYLNFSIATCVVLMLLGQCLLLAGMYGRVGSDDEARAWQDNRLRL